jgi:hypothetical protein
MLYAPGVGFLAAFVYLVVLGGMRRWLIPALGWAPNDPLVLVGPAVVGVYFCVLFVHRRVRPDSTLSHLLSWLLMMMVLQIFNPLQGGLAAGLAGALFYIVPLLWCYLGREIGRPELMRGLFTVTIGLSLLAALYGLFQTWFGFTAGEEAWMDRVRYAALNVDGTIRPFSFLTSAAEYAYLLGLGIVLLWAAWLCGHRIALIPVPLLMVALFLESSRAIFLFTLAACTVLWAVQGSTYSSWVPRGILAVAIAVAGLTWSLTHVQQSRFSQQTQALAEHQASGLLNPLDPEHSTVHIHVSMVNHGLAGALRNPLGYGLGATTLAGRKFGATGASAELDLVNVLVSLGFVGGLIYAALVGVCVGMAVRYWRASRTFTSLGLLGILVLTLGQWLNGGQYAVSTLVWFCIGSLDRARGGG